MPTNMGHYFWVNLTLTLLAHGSQQAPDVQDQILTSNPHLAAAQAPTPPGSRQAPGGEDQILPPNTHLAATSAPHKHPGEDNILMAATRAPVKAANQAPDTPIKRHLNNQKSPNTTKTVGASTLRRKWPRESQPEV